jgi:hypothetical protein
MIGSGEMRAKASAFRALGLSLTLGGALFLSGCGQGEQKQGADSAPPAGRSAAPASIPMGTGRSVTRFFVTSKGGGKGGDLGGLDGADAHCQALAQAQGAGDHTWRAYLSTQAIGNARAVNARDRIGGGPWYNANGDLIAQNLAQLNGAMSKLAKDAVVTEGADDVDPGSHAMLTGSRPDGTAFPAGADRTCGNWTSSGEGSAQIGYFDREGEGENSNSWNSAHGTTGCSEEALRASGGSGLFYCFAVD